MRKLKLLIEKTKTIIRKQREDKKSREQKIGRKEKRKNK